ncbi:hypothetical protein SIID45300_00169 [Candidatus Magnetaquicoccaceae bacterium FCR-1]|uniref:Cadherin domain-containing protein n=1 Tax=Candidatus Magnetaquiglobus chichijimensis TaxID=3141448 RepID=A0ABQ0C4R6_9PROT
MRNLLRNKRLVAMVLVALLAALGGYLLLIPDGGQRSKPITVERAKVATPDKKGAEAPQPKSVAESAAQREPVGTVTQFKGLAYASFESVKRTLAEGATLFPGDQVVTGKETRLIMKMRDDAVIALGPESEFLVQEYRFEPEEAAGNGVVNMTKGMVRFTSGKLAKMKDQPFKVVTPVATLGVRGTEGFVRLGDGKGKDREIEVITLQKELLVWMEEAGRPAPKASSGELFFSKGWSLINDAWAADTSKAPLAVRHGERLTGSANKAPEVRKATREELRGAYGSTTLRKISPKTREKLTSQVAKSLVDKGLAPDKATAEALLKKSPHALDELVSKAEEKLEKELEKAIEKRIDADEKIAALDEKLKETVGAEGAAKLQEIERQQAEQLETLRRERAEQLAAIVTDPALKPDADAIVAGHDERQIELHAELGEKIAKVEAEGDTRKQAELKAELNNKLAELEKETRRSLESLLGTEQASKVQEAVAETAKRETQLATQIAHQIEAVVPKEQLEIVRSIEGQKGRVESATPFNLNDLSQTTATTKAQEEAIRAIEAVTTSLINGVADAVKAGVPLDKVIQGLDDAAVERQRTEATRLGVDLETATKNAEELLKVLETSPLAAKKGKESDKPKETTKTEEPAKPAESTEPPVEPKKSEEPPKATTTAPVTPTATTTIPGIAPTPLDAASTLSSSGFSSTTTTTTTVTINNAPTIALQTFTISENAAKGTIVGTLVATDPDVADQGKLQFSLGENFGGAFGVDSSTGQITVLDPSKLDFETNPTIRLTAVVKDLPKSGTASATVWVVLTDVNEAPTVTSGSSGTLVENESGTVYTATAFDPDKDDTLTWSLSGTDAGFFRIDATGVVTFRNPPDFENANHAPTYVFDAIATDKKGLFGSKTVTITVTDRNEAPVITSEAGVLFAENGAGIAYQATATDPDASDKNKLTWSLSGNDAALFEINAQTGAVRFLAKPDFESPKDVGGDNVYNLTVSVTDTGWEGSAALSTSKEITITVVDQSTVTVTSAESVTFDENGTGIAYQAKATDPDPGDDPRIWSMVGADESLFNIDAASGAVTFKQPPDYENPKDHGKQNSYHITIQVSDKGKFFASKAVTINVLDLNEKPVIAVSSPSAVTFAENGSGSAYQATASDPDKSDTLSWSLSGADEDWFTINADTGAVSFRLPPDFESASHGPVYAITVKVQDKGGLNDSKAVTITVTDVNEAPVVNSGASATFVENGTGVVYTATATDPDAKDLFGWSVGGADKAFFTIDPTTGELRFKTPPDFENTSHGPVYAIDVIATDRAGLAGSKSVTITVTDQPPTITSGPSATFAENGTGVAYQATATQLDAGDGTRVWTHSGLDAARFTIDAATGAVRFVTPPDFEAPNDVGRDNLYEINVIVTDKGSLSDSRAITITVTDINEAPKISATAPASLPFNENGSGVAYQTVAFDPDAGDVIAWSLGGADAGLFTIDATTGAVRFVTPPDFESATHLPAYALTLTVTDKFGLTDAKAITITVVDVNEAPVITSAAGVNFAENGTGVAYQATATDPDAGDAITWKLAGPDAGLFTIDATTGAVSFKAAPDYETPLDVGGNNVYDIQLTVTDKAGLSASQAVTITVTPVNEAPKIASSAPSSVTFNENGTGVVYQTTATDPDGDLLTWALSGADALSFIIDATTGAVRFVNPPDFENATHGPTYAITVTVTDGGGLFDARPVTITVTDLNEAPVVTSAAGVNFAENGTGVAYQATATDPDANDAFTWSLSGADAALFNLDAVTGEVRFNVSPDYENPQDVGKNNVYDIVVTATDKKGLSSALNVAITVTDVIERPSITSGPTATFLENATGIAYQATAAPPEVGDVLSWSLSGADSGRFAIDSVTGAVTFLAPPDFETPLDAGADNVYTINVIVTNKLNLSDTKAVAITVTNVNEKPVIDPNAPAAKDFVENGTGVAYQTTATDPDAGDVLTWTLGGADVSLFDINAVTGAVTFKAAPDFESAVHAPTYALTLTVADRDGLFDSKAVTINVTNLNEKPTIDPTAPAAKNFAENGVGVAYQTTATDPDAGDTLTWSLTGTDAAFFAIDPATGAVTFLASPDYESATHGPAYAINLVVTDAGGLADTKAVTLNVTNVNEAPVIDPLALSAVTFAENATGTVYQTTATDPDVPDTLTWSLGGADAALFTINATSGAVTFLTPPDFEHVHGPTYAIDVIVTDALGLNATKSVTVTVTNVNEAPVIDPTAPAAKDFAENGVGVAYQTTATDPDAGDILTWSLTGTDAAFFAIDPATGAVTFLASPDYESATHGPAYAINLVVTDSGGLAAIKAVTLNVTNVNEAPVIDPLALSAVTFAENATGTVYQTTATDPDVPDILTWSLGGADAAFFAINPTTGAVTFLTPPDFEHVHGPTYAIDVIVTDALGLNATKSVTVTVTNVNEAPVIDPAAPAAKDFAENGTGVAYQTTATDQDAGDTLTWSLTGTDAAFFAIDPATGAVSFLASPDYESATHGPAYAINLVVTDSGGLAATKAVTLNVTNVNEAPVIDPLALSAVTFAENATGTVYQTTATDPDVPDTLTWSLGGADAASFAINPTTGAVTFLTPPDFEHVHGPIYAIDVIVTDALGLNATKSVTVTVTNVNEAPVIDPAAPAAKDFAENGTGVAYQTTATDQDAGDTLTWSLTGTDAAFFAIDPATGAVSFLASPDYEAAHGPAYAINLVVTDSGGLAATKAVTLNVTNVNEAPVIDPLALSAVTFAENATGTVYQTTATDPDVPDTLTWSLGGADAASFAINPTTGAVTFLTPPDFEHVHGPTYAIDVIVTDALGLNATKSVTVTVTNVNEAPVIDPAAPAAKDFAENGTGIAYQTTATDQDAGDTLTWSLTGTDAAFFAIDPTTGAVSFLASPDYEAAHGPAYAINLVVTDSGGLAATKAVTLNVTNVNEAPVIDPLALSAVTFAENATGTVYQTTATDPDVPDTLTWSLGGADAALFTINATSGAVTFLTPPDFEHVHGPTYAIDVIVTDALGLNATKSVTVTVTNVNEAPVIDPAAPAAKDFAENGVGVAYQTTATDPDAGDTLTWSLTGTDAAFFAIDPATGAVTFLVPPDYEAAHGPAYAVTVVVTDSGGLTATKAVTINVTDVNETPQITSTLAVNFAENGTGTAYPATASDPDTAHGDLLTWTIAGGADAALFTINASTGAVTFLTSPNYEAPTDAGADNVYDLTLTVTDTLGLFDTKSVTITVTDVNEPPVINSATSVPNVVEGTTTAIYTATATDPENNPFTWSLSGPDAASFTIDANTGALTPSALLRYGSPADVGADNVYNVTLVATDNGTPVQAGTLDITVTIISKIDLSNLTVYENADLGTVIGQLSALNPEGGVTFSFSLAANLENLFDVQTSGTNVYLVVGSAAVKPLVVGDHAVTLRMDDTLGRTFTRPVLVTVQTVPFDMTGALVVNDATYKADGELVLKSIVKGLYRASNDATGRTVDLSETDIAKLIVGKLGQQISNVTFTKSLQEVLPMLRVELLPADDAQMIRVRARIGVVEAMYARLPASVRTEFGTWFDTFFNAVAPYATNYTTDLQIRLMPYLQTVPDGAGSHVELCVDLAGSTLEVLNLRMVPRIGMDMASMLTSYNATIRQLLKSDGSLTFFTGGGGNGPAKHFLDQAMKEATQANQIANAPAGSVIQKGFNTQIAADGRSVQAYDASNHTSQQIPTCQRIDYYLPGWINGISITSGNVQLTR